MKTELICTGSELLTGEKINTNVAYIGERLRSIGIELARATTAGDNLKEITEIFSVAIAGSDIVIVTGGLGPTFDDLTRKAASKALRKKLVFSREIMQEIARHFADRGMEMPKGNESQAYIIDGATPIPNRIGTAPGQIIDYRKQDRETLIFLLPGPPKELYPMVEYTLLPCIKKKYPHVIIKSKALHVYGLTESKVNEIITPLIEAKRSADAGQVTFSILSHFSIIDVQFSMRGTDELLIDETLRKIKTSFYALLKENIYGEDHQSLESVVGESLLRNKKTLSVAESCTGGHLSNRITNVPGSSAYFRGGMVSYSNTSKIDVLGVAPATIDTYGAVSEETAIEMARGVKKIITSDYAVAISGVAGPSGGTSLKPVGLVCFALVTPVAEYTEKKKFTGSRHEIKENSVNFALDVLRRRMV